MNRKLSLDELNRHSVEDYRSIDKAPIAILLDDIRSFNNVGSVFRTADAFMVEHIYLCGITPQPPHRDIQKTALGATESVEWSHSDNAISTCKSLKNEGYDIVIIEQTEESTSLRSFQLIPRHPTLLVFGNEVAGVDEELVALADRSIQIEQYGTKHSLNISVCAGIVLWDVFNKWSENN